MAFPPMRLRSGIILGRGTEAFQHFGLPLWESFRECVSPSQPLTRENLAYFFGKVNPLGEKCPVGEGKVLAEESA